MLGLLDRGYALWNKIGPKKITSWAPTIVDDGIGEKWYCFVPKTILANKKLRDRLIPNKGNVVIYQVSYNNLMVNDVNETLSNLKAVYEDAILKIQEDVRLSRKINLLGISLGNIFAFRVLGEIKNVKNLVSLVGGGRFGASAWDSILTKNIARNSGCDSIENYEKTLERFSPVNYVKGVRVENLFARFGGWDLAIPYQPHGKELKNGLSKIKVDKKDVKTYKFTDHLSTLLCLCEENIYG